MNTNTGLDDAYNDEILPLLRRMLNLEHLTLCLALCELLAAIDATRIENDILLRIPRLRLFDFSIRSRGAMAGNGYGPESSKDIQWTFPNGRIGQFRSCVSHTISGLVQCHLYSLPYRLPELYHITNSFLNGHFHSVRRLIVSDKRPFEHEFFDRIAQAFPLLTNLTLYNYEAQKYKRHQQINDENIASSVVTYPHLTCLHLRRSHQNYLEELFFNTNTRLPLLTELYVTYSHLKAATENFKSEAIRVNCAKLTRLFLSRNDIIDCTTSFYWYFPLLQLIRSYD